MSCWRAAPAVALGLTSVVASTAGGVALAQGKHRPTILYLGDTKRHGQYETSLYRAHPGSPSNRIRLHLTARTYMNGVAISPDGEHIVESLYRLTNVRRPNQIVIADRDGRHRRIVVRRVGFSDFYTVPTWSPDSSTLYFSRYPRSSNQSLPPQLFSVNANKSDPAVKRVAGGALLQDPAMSPDGTTIAAIEATYDGHQATSSSLVTLDLATGARSSPLLTDDDPTAPLTDPTWSPDGSRIAVVRSTTLGHQDNFTTVIDVLAADGSDHGTPVVAADGGTQFFVGGPAWRSARQLWFSRNFESEGSTDIERPDSPADLFSVKVTSRGFATPIRRTHTKRLSEYSLSFSR